MSSTMSSRMPWRGPTETLTVDLATIRQDSSWPVDPELVASFRASIRRGEPPLLDLSLNRVRSVDGTGDAGVVETAETAETLEIIDGMHRLEALRLEGITTHSAKVREYSPQDAFYARIATSIGKPNELFRQRAERALREGFVRDVAAHLEGATVYQHGVADDGAPRPTPRREPLPADPLLALGTILWVHFAAKPAVTEDWERFVLAWLDDIARRLGKTPAWLRDEVLQITALLGPDLPGKPSAERARLLLAIPDDGILRLALARLKAEPKLSTTDLRFALDILGCGPDVGRHSWLTPRRLPQMRSMLAHASLSQLARDYTAALARAEAAARVVRFPVPPQAPSAPHPLPAMPPAPHPPPATPSDAPSSNVASPGVASPGTPSSGASAAPASPPLPPDAPAPGPPRQAEIRLPGATTDADFHRAADHPTSAEHPVTLRDGNAVFGVVSARFGSTETHVANTTPPQTPQSSENASAPTDDLFLPAQRLADALISAWQTYEQHGGDWSRPAIQQELTRLRRVIDAYLARSAGALSQDPTT